MNMSKVSTMQAHLAAAAGRAEQAPPAQLTHATSVTSSKPKSREGRVHVGAWLPEAYSRNLLLVRAKTGMAPKVIFAAALNDLFRAHNIPVIDEE